MNILLYRNSRPDQGSCLDLLNVTKEFLLSSRDLKSMHIIKDFSSLQHLLNFIAKLFLFSFLLPFQILCLHFLDLRTQILKHNMNLHQRRISTRSGSPTLTATARGEIILDSLFLSIDLLNIEKQKYELSRNFGLFGALCNNL